MSVYLMNKDARVLEFVIDSISGISSIRVVNVFNDSLIPLSLRSSGSLQGWLDDRLVMGLITVK